MCPCPCPVTKKRAHLEADNSASHTYLLFRVGWPLLNAASFGLAIAYYCPPHHLTVEQTRAVCSLKPHTSLSSLGNCGAVRSRETFGVFILLGAN